MRLRATEGRRNGWAKVVIVEPKAAWSTAKDTFRNDHALKRLYDIGG
jgi:hypothetical protein